MNEFAGESDQKVLRRIRTRARCNYILVSASGRSEARHRTDCHGKARVLNSRRGAGASAGGGACCSFMFVQCTLLTCCSFVLPANPQRVTHRRDAAAAAPKTVQHREKTRGRICQYRGCKVLFLQKLHEICFENLVS